MNETTYDAQPGRDGSQAHREGCPPGQRGGARRKKLWELNEGLHCPVVGTCLNLRELRKLASRAEIGSETGALDRKYRAAIARFSEAQDEEESADLWEDALARGMRRYWGVG